MNGAQNTERAWFDTILSIFFRTLITSISSVLGRAERGKGPAAQAKTSARALHPAQLKGDHLLFQCEGSKICLSDVAKLGLRASLAQ